MGAPSAKPPADTPPSSSFFEKCFELCGIHFHLRDETIRVSVIILKKCGGTEKSFDVIMNKKILLIAVFKTPNLFFFALNDNLVLKLLEVIRTHTDILFQ